MSKVVTFVAKEKVELREDATPEVKPGDLLLQATRTLISTGTEMIVLQQNFEPGTHWAGWAVFPFRAGYSFAGKVAKVGAGVEGWKVGDRAASRCWHASEIVQPATACVRIPDGVTDEEATWFGLGKIVQIGVRAAEHKMGDVVAIIGMGPLGQLVTQYARLMGASEVIAIDTAPKRLEWAAAHGATSTLQMTAAEALDEVKRLSGGRGADVVYDVTGHPKVFASALTLARRFGRVVLLGDAGQPSEQRLTIDVVTRGLTIVGAHDGHPPDQPTDLVRWSNQQMYDLFLKYVARKQIRVGDLITHHFKPANCQDAYNVLKEKRDQAMGVMFDWA